MWYQREFPDFDESLEYIYRDLNVYLGEWTGPGVCFQRWFDSSWHNDSCPKFVYAIGAPYDENMDLQLYVDYVDLNKSQNDESRRDGNIKRYDLYNCEGCDEVFKTDNWQEMLFFIRGYVDALKAACVNLADKDIWAETKYKKLSHMSPTYYRVRRFEKWGDNPIAIEAE